MTSISIRPLPNPLRAGVRAALVAAIAIPGTAQAVDFNAGSWNGSFDTTVSFGQTWRNEARDARLIGTANGGTGRSRTSMTAISITGRGARRVRTRRCRSWPLTARTSGFLCAASCFTTPWSRIRRPSARRFRKPARMSRVLTCDCSMRSLRQLGRWRARSRHPCRPAGRQLGREHVYPGRHQQRHQPFRRIGAARTGLGIARSLPAPGNPESRIRNDGQPDGGGARHLRLESHSSRSRSALTSRAMISCRAVASRSFWASAHFPTSVPISRRSADRSSRISRAFRAAKRTIPATRASTACRCAGSFPISARDEGTRFLLRQLSQQAAGDQRHHRDPGRRRQLDRNADRGRRHRAVARGGPAVRCSGRDRVGPGRAGSRRAGWQPVARRQRAMPRLRAIPSSAAATWPRRRGTSRPTENMRRRRSTSPSIRKTSSCSESRSIRSSACRAWPCRAKFPSARTCRCNSTTSNCCSRR